MSALAWPEPNQILSDSSVYLVFERSLGEVRKKRPTQLLAHAGAHRIQAAGHGGCPTVAMMSGDGSEKLGSWTRHKHRSTATQQRADKELHPHYRSSKGLNFN